MKASITNLTYLYPDNAFKIQCCSTIIGIRKKVERQARLQNLFQNEKTSKVAYPSSTCTEIAIHITPLSPWRGAGGEAFLGEGLGVRPVEGTRLFGERPVVRPFTLSPYNAVLPRLSI